MEGVGIRGKREYWERGLDLDAVSVFLLYSEEVEI